MRPIIRTMTILLFGALLCSCVEDGAYYSEVTHYHTNISPPSSPGYYSTQTPPAPPSTTYYPPAPTPSSGFYSSQTPPAPPSSNTYYSGVGSTTSHSGYYSR